MISSASSFRKRADMASGPVALCALRLLNSLWTPRGLMTMLSIVENGLGPLSGVWLVSSEVKTDLNCSFRMLALDCGSLVISPSEFRNGATPEASCFLLFINDQNFLGFSEALGVMMSSIYC